MANEGADQQRRYVDMLYLLCIAIVMMLLSGPFAYKTIGRCLKKIEKFEERSGCRLSAKEKVRRMR